MVISLLLLCFCICRESFVFSLFHLYSSIVYISSARLFTLFWRCRSLDVLLVFVVISRFSVVIWGVQFGLVLPAVFLWYCMIVLVFFVSHII